MNFYFVSFWNVSLQLTEQSLICLYARFVTGSKACFENLNEEVSETLIEDSVVRFI